MIFGALHISIRPPHFRNYNMIHFTERKHLIHWITQNCTRKSVVRAMDEGTVENFGAFRDIGPVPVQSGWIVKVTSDTGKIWTLEIVPRPASKRWHGYSIYITGHIAYDDSSILWDHWLYDNVAEPFTNPVYIGDNPTEYARLRDERRKELTKDIAKKD